MLQAIAVRTPYGNSSLTIWGVYNPATKHVAVPPTAFLIHRAIQDGIADSTLRGNAYTLTSYFNVLKRNNINWRDISDTQMRKYFEGILFKHRNLSGASITNHIGLLSGFYTWAEKYGWCDSFDRFSFKMSNELLEELELAKGNTDGNLPFNLNSQYIDKKEFREFLNFNSGRQDYEIQRNEIILELGYLCGCRAAEVVFKQNFRARQLKKIFNAQKVETSLNDGFELGIIGKGASGGKHRIIWVPDDLSRKLKAYFQRSKTLGDGNIICTKNGKHLNKQFASSVFTNTRHNLLIQSQDLGDWGSPSRSFHSLRHSYATNFILDNGSHDAMRSLLKSRMGHEDFKTTEIYLTFSAILRGETYMQKTETNHEQ